MGPNYGTGGGFDFRHLRAFLINSLILHSILSNLLPHHFHFLFPNVMKRAIIAVALTLIVAGSWAFHPKIAEPSGYMYVIGHIYTNYSLIIINPDGESATQVIDESLHSNSPDKISKATLQLRQAEIRKINELKLAGWKVINMAVDRGDIVYLLEK
jgi:hypothetical protein